MTDNLELKYLKSILKTDQEKKSWNGWIKN